MLGKKKSLLLALLLLALCLLAYIQAPTGRYVYDDIHVIEENLNIEDWMSLSRLVTSRYGPTFGEMSYRPLVSLSYFIDSIAFQKDPFFSRLFNILLHYANGLLLYLLWRKLLHDRALAFVAVAFFLVHPIASEVVLSPGFREDLLAGLGLIGTIILLQKMAIRKNVKYGFWAALAWFGGLLSKETAFMAVALAPVLLLRYGPQAAVLRKPDPEMKRRILLTAVAALVLFCIFFIAYTALKPPGEAGYVAYRERMQALGLFDNGADDSKWPGGQGPTLGFLNFARSTLTYSRLWLVPTNLSICHWYLPSRSYGDYRLWLGLALLLSCTGLSVYGYYKKSPFGAGGLWALITLAPLSQIIPTPEILAERYLYPAHMGLSLALAAILLGTPGERQKMPRDSLLLRRGLIGLSLTLCVTLTFIRVDDWRHNVALNISAYEQWNNAYGDTALAALYLQQGRHSEAIKAAQRALDTNPDIDDAHRILGVYMMESGKLEKAREHFRKAYELDPEDPMNRAALEALSQAMQ